MWRRACLLSALLALAPLPTAAAATPAALGHASRARVRPRAFASCAGLIGYARRHFATTRGLPAPPVTPVAQPVLGPAPLGANAPSVTAAPTTGTSSGTTPFSTTNTQEQGIDEPDIVKTDGSTIFVASQGTLFAVMVTGHAPRLTGSLDLGTGAYGAQLLLRGSRLIVISGSGPLPLAPGRPLPLGLGPGAGTRGRAVLAPSPALAPSPYYYGGQTTLTEVDVHDPAAMKVTRTMTVDGTFVDARQNGATARVVISSAPRAIALAGARAQAGGWVPASRFHSLVSGRSYARPVAPCDAVRRPVQFSGLGMLTILTIDIDRGLWTAGSSALMADAQVVYGSAASLYVATEKWIDPRTAPNQLPLSQTTVIDRFDATKPDSTPFVSAGEVPGYLLNQFSLSENKGFLRVASTSRPIWWSVSGRSGAGAGPGSPTPSQSYVTVLADRAGSLVPVGQLSGLGAGQQIYSVRFVGDAGYVVTFRQVDPLYTIDLSNPSAPRVAGQLELQGYSSYLHPVGEGRLLGVGQDVGAGLNEPAGTQLELFDVSNPAAPKLLARTTLGNGSSSEVQTDHHAFLFWPPAELAVIPVQIFSVSPEPAPPFAGGSTGAGSGRGRAAVGTGGFTGAIGFHVDTAGITEMGRISHEPVNGQAPAIRRAVVVGDRLYTVSAAGVMASRLDNLARVAFVPFPQPQPQPGPTGSGVVSPPATARPG